MFIAAFFITAKLGNSLDVPQLMNGLRKCGIDTKLSFIQP
jgi:hypothetical protein